MKKPLNSTKIVVAIWIILSISFVLVTEARAQAQGEEFINIGAPLKGSWYNRTMPGQGFFVEFFVDRKYGFIGWFTFPRQPENITGVLKPHRWYTLEGLYSGNLFQADIYETTGGEFVDPFPVTANVIGTARVQFTSCNTGEIEYEFFDSNEQGLLPVTRIVRVDEAECEDLIQPDPPPAEVDVSQTTVIQNVSVVGMPDVTIQRDQTVIVENGTITYVGAAAQAPSVPDAAIIDGRSRYLMPGLVDAHTHLADYVRNASRNEIIRNQLMLYAANGVTTVLNNGDINQPVLSWKSQVENGDLYGPHIYTAQFAFGGNTRNPNASRNFVRATKAQGYDYMKLYEDVAKDSAIALMDEARIQDMPVIAHFPRSTSVDEILDNGLDLVAHMNQYGAGYFNYQFNQGQIPSAIELSLRNKTTVTATLFMDEVKAQVIGNNQDGADAIWARPEMRYVHSMTRDFMLQSLNFPFWNPQGSSPGDYDPNLEFHRLLTYEFHNAGIPILMGTDSPGLTITGFSSYDEMKALLTVGIPLPDVLRIATWNGGAFISDSLNLPQRFGAVQEGYRGDLLLLESNPLVSVEHLREITGVMIAGRWRSASFFEQELENIATSYEE